MLHFRQAFYQTGWSYFQGFIFALLISNGRKCVTRIANTCFFIDKSLSSWERFLAEAQWDINQVISSLIGLLKSELGDQLLYASHYLLAVDPTIVAKVKGKMSGVQKWSQSSINPDRSKEVIGHHWAIGGLLVRIANKWHCCPVIARLLSGRSNPSHFVVSESGEIQPMNLLSTVLAVVFQVAQVLGGISLCVVVDAFFSKANFLNPLIEKAIVVVTQLRHDAVGWESPQYSGRGRPPLRGKKWKLATSPNA